MLGEVLGNHLTKDVADPHAAVITTRIGTVDILAKGPDSAVMVMCQDALSVLRFLNLNLDLFNSWKCLLKAHFSREGITGLRKNIGCLFVSLCHVAPTFLK